MAESNWQPIKTARKDGTDLLLWGGSYHVGRFVCIQTDGTDSDWFTDDRVIEPTEWQFLPTPPQAEGGE